VHTIPAPREPLYQSDLIDEQWALVLALLSPAGEGGRQDLTTSEAMSHWDAIG
jgi:hypothetical protein